MLEWEEKISQFPVFWRTAHGFRASKPTLRRFLVRPFLPQNEAHFIQFRQTAFGKSIQIFLYIYKMMHKSLEWSQMEYCSSVWDPNKNGDVATQEKVQRRAARFVKNDYRRKSSVSKMIKELGWHSLQEHRAMSGLTLMQKIVHSLVDVDPFKLVDSGRETRRSTSQHRFRNIMANKNCYRFSRGLCGVICPTIFAVPTQGRLSGSSCTRDRHCGPELL